MNLVVIETGRPDTGLTSALGAHFRTTEFAASDADEGTGADGSDLVELERRLTEAPPDALVLGGTGMPAVGVALVAAKLQIPIVRIAAGAGFAGRATARQPVAEEALGRVCDRLAALLLCAGEREERALAAAGMGERTAIVGADPERVVAALRERLGAE